MIGRTWQVESVIPCGIKRNGVKCANTSFTAMAGRGDRPPVFKCNRCGFIKYRLVIAPRKEEGD